MTEGRTLAPLAALCVLAAGLFAAIVTGLDRLSAYTYPSSASPPASAGSSPERRRHARRGFWPAQRPPLCGWLSHSPRPRSTASRPRSPAVAFCQHEPRLACGYLDDAAAAAASDAKAEAAAAA